MVSAPNLIENAKRKLGFSLVKGAAQNPYRKWRQTVQTEARKVVDDFITGIKHARFGELRTLSVGYKTFPGKPLLDQEVEKMPGTYRGGPCHKALDTLLADSLKKIMAIERQCQQAEIEEAESVRIIVLTPN